MEQQAKNSQPSLPGVPLSMVPGQAIAYLEAVRRYYQPGVTRLPRNADIAAAHMPRLNSRTWDRRKADLRDKKWAGRDWIEVWPPPRDWHPSWEPLLLESLAPVTPAPGDQENGVVHLTYDEVYDRTGKLIERRLIRTLGHLGAVAALVLYSLCLRGHFIHLMGMHVRLS